MKKTTVRALERNDIEKMRELLLNREDLDPQKVDRRLKIIEWIAFNNPYAGREPTYFIAHDGEKIVAHLGRMPLEFRIKGKVRKGYFAHDLFVHPDYRKGSGFFIVSSLYRAVEKQSDSFCCLVWTTDLNLELQRRRGYVETSCERYYKFFDPYPKLKKAVKPEMAARIASGPLKLLFWVGDLVLTAGKIDSTSIDKIASFDPRFDELNSRIAGKVGICVNKTSKYLNWRYLNKPFGGFDVFAASKNGIILGFIVLNITPKSDSLDGTIVDLMTDPDDRQTISALLKTAIIFFKQKGVQTIRCCMSDDRYSSALRKFLFFKDHIKREPVMMANLDKCEDKNDIAQIKNWHLTYGASDELMFDSLE